MSKTTLRYDRMVENALRGVVREALSVASVRGLPGAHHFYITFRTSYPGVDIPDFLSAQYPQDMTIVLEHQFWGLEVDETKFAVTLSFRNQPQRLTVPLAAITEFADPSVKFGLEFPSASEAPEAPAPVERLQTSGPVPAPVALTPASTSASSSASSASSEKPASAADGEKAGEVVKLDQFRRK